MAFSKPASPTFSQFQSTPAQDGFSNRPDAAARERVPLKHKPPTVIGSPPLICQAPCARNLRKTAIVEPDEMKERNRGRGRKNRFGQRFSASSERLRSYAESVKTHIQQKRQAHQVEIAHVFIFVLVNRLKPTVVAPREIPIMPGDQRRKRLSSLLGQDQFGGR